MRIIALEPYRGGSHDAFLTGWARHSRHAWTVLGLPPYKWKWRMRHGAITLAQQVRQQLEAGQAWDLLFCSDMLNLAEFRGLVPPAIQTLPTVAYFHENQLTYPVRCESERDYHYVFTNLTTALAAEAVWFNSAYHRDAFLDGLPGFLKRMPDYQPFEAIDRIRAKSAVQPPGIEAVPMRAPRKAGPLHILWAARWEHDKDPDTFFAALDLLEDRQVPFALSVIGEQFRDAPPVFATARRRFADRIVHWGYQPSRSAYEAVLAEADVVVSTALHEFFGISMVEAIMVGAVPLLPRRLAYPEVLSLDDESGRGCFFYDGSPGALADRLTSWAALVDSPAEFQRLRTTARGAVERFSWDRRAAGMDAALETLVAGSR